jgi:nucleotide-binding universal stress UspA family protein
VPPPSGRPSPQHQPFGPQARRLWNAYTCVNGTIVPGASIRYARGLTRSGLTRERRCTVFTRLLIPLDRSEEAAWAIQPALSLAETYGARITLVMVMFRAPLSHSGEGVFFETCDGATPNVITPGETTWATDQDVTAVNTLHQALAEQAWRPAVHLVDGAYPSGETLVRSQQNSQVDLVGPRRQDQSWQAHDDQAYDTSHFHMAGDQETVTCPMGHQSQPWKPAKEPRGKPMIHVHFPKKAYAVCDVRTRCTRSPMGPRELTLHPTDQHLALQAARDHQRTETFKERSTHRAGI